MDLKILRDIPPWEWPKEAGQLFLTVMSDREAPEEDRLLAAELGGDFTVVNDDLAITLLSLGQDARETEEMRTTALISLGAALEHSYVTEFEDPDDIVIGEETYIHIIKSLHGMYFDAGVPEEVRRRVLEVAVRAPQDWHQEAVRGAYNSGDELWKLSAVFCMRYIRGFDDQIIEALDSTDQETLFHAVCAAGAWEVGEAWPHVKAVITGKASDKDLLISAFESAATVNPPEAIELLGDFIYHEDREIAEAAIEAMALAKGLSSLEDYDDMDDDIEGYDDEDDDFYH